MGVDFYARHIVGVTIESLNARQWETEEISVEGDEPITQVFTKIGDELFMGSLKDTLKDLTADEDDGDEGLQVYTSEDVEEIDDEDFIAYGVFGVLVAKAKDYDPTVVIDDEKAAKAKEKVDSFLEEKFKVKILSQSIIQLAVVC